MSGTATIAWIDNGVLAPTYTTWNSADKDGDIILSGGDLTTAVTGGGTGGIRSLIGKATGKWYWEYYMTTLDTKQVILGIANTTWNLTNNYLAYDTNGWGYYANLGDKITNDVATSYAAAASDGNVLGVLLNMTDGEISFRVNNTDVGVAYTGLTGTIYAAIGNINANHTITANFGASAFTYGVPAGYNSGLYN